MSDINNTYIPPPDNFSSDFSNLNNKQKIKKASEQFEAFFLEEIMKDAAKSFASSSDFQENTYYDMFYQDIAKVLSEAGGVGFGKFIEKAVEQELQNQENPKNKINGKA